jgi:tRNA (guanine-N7-)-methyltransferase
MELDEPSFLGRAEVGEALAIDHDRNLEQAEPCPVRRLTSDTMAPVDNALPPAHPRQKYTEDGQRMREVLSYSRRGGRFTPSQQESWDAHHRDWVVPDEAVDDPSFSWDRAFGRSAPRIVEIGSGVGEATAVLAAQRRSYDVVALEVWRPGVAHTLGLLAEEGAENVRLLSVDAVWCLEHLFAAGEVEELWTFFPDPWPKKRHHKRRLVTPEFAALAASRLRPGGLWRLATDWAAYAGQMRVVLDAEPRLEGGPVERWSDRPVTKFERKGIAADREIVDLAYRRK